MTWRKVYFKSGHRYKVLRSFDQDVRNSEQWKIGEVLVFVKDVFGVYDSITKYLFDVESDQRENRVIALYDDQPEPNWAEYFEEIG